jgi:hypothetical protein
MRFKLRNALIGIVLYLVLFGAVFSVDSRLLAALLIYVAVTMLISRALISNAELRRTRNIIEFSQKDAEVPIGVVVGSFHHVYYSPKAVNEALVNALGSALKVKLGCAGFREICFKDVDKTLAKPETRTFFIALAPDTQRNSACSLMCAFDRATSIQSIRWWILVRGLKDPNKVFWRYVLAPISVPVVLLPYINREYDPLNGLMTIWPGFFNGIDVLNRSREIQYVAFETLVEVLDAFGIDTTDLKQQRSSILNVNVSGGQASFGAIVQGAMNKVRGASRGVTSESPPVS